MFCNIEVNGRKMTLSKEEDIEIQRKLRILNKPPVKTLQIDGITFDCIKINKQPAFDHPLLINHTIQMRPSSLAVETNPRSAVSSTMPLGSKLRNEGCSPGTVIIRRTTKENLINSKLFSTFSWSKKPIDQPPIFPRPGHQSPPPPPTDNHHSALFRTNFEDFYGAKGSPTVYGVPGMPRTHGSSVYLILGRGEDNTYNAIHAGWSVSPQDYGDDRTHLSIVWTTDGYGKGGCMDLSCPGFVQVDKRVTPGYVFPRLSIYNGTQYEIQIIISKDKQSGNWWLMLGPNKLPIGYWPSSIVPGLADYAKVIYMGGITQAPHNEPGPPMGSGHFAEEGFSKASSFTGVQYIDANNNFQYPKHHDKYVDESVCYNMGDAFDSDQHNGLAFFFGGPGGCTR